MRRLTFSKLPLLEACAAAGVLPWVSSESAAGRRGSVLHAFLHDVLTIGRDAALDRVPADMREAAQDWDLAGLPSDPTAFRGEIAFAIDVDRGTARVLGENLGRDYEAAGALEHEVVGAGDAIAFVGTTGVLVAELKTGWRYVPPPALNLQVRAQLAAASLAYGRDDGVGVIHHRREDNSGWTERATFDAFDVAETMDRIRRIRDSVSAERDGGQPMKFREGEWCRTCPAMPLCPAKKDLALELAEASATPDDYVEAWKKALTPELARRAFDKRAAIKALLERIDAVLEEYATHHPIDLGGGRVYGPTQTKRDSLDGKVVWQLLEEQLGTEAAWEGVELKATKAGVERVLKKAIAGTDKKITHEKARVLGEVARRGGVFTKYTDSVRIHPAKKGKDADEEAA